MFGLIGSSYVCHKLGCFKRKTLEYYQDQEEEARQAAPLAPTNETVSQSETDDKSDQLAEEKMFLDDGEVSGSSPPTDTMEVLE